VLVNRDVMTQVKLSSFCEILIIVRPAAKFGRHKRDGFCDVQFNEPPSRGNVQRLFVNQIRFEAGAKECSDSNIRIPFQRTLWRMLAIEPMSRLPRRRHLRRGHA
jgi:hypothetical protein